MSIAFTKATKTKAKLRLALAGTAGSGKTYSALEVAKCLGGRVAVIDTEHGSASKYADRFHFDVMEPEEFSPETYIRGIQAAAAGGYDVLVLDSLSHEWTGKGGALELVDRLSAGGNKFTDGWGKVTPMHTRLVDAMLAFPGHVIATMRAKTKYEVEKNEKGKAVPRKVGMETVQRDGMDYEFDVMAILDTDGNVRIDKTRCPELSGTRGLMKWSDIPKMTATLQAWLSDGVEAPPARKPDTHVVQEELPVTDDQVEFTMRVEQRREAKTALQKALAIKGLSADMAARVVAAAEAANAS